MVNYDITIPAEIILLIVIWICCTIYAIITKDRNGMSAALIMSVLFGVYKVFIFLKRYNN